MALFPAFALTGCAGEAAPEAEPSESTTEAFTAVTPTREAVLATKQPAAAAQGVGSWKVARQKNDVVISALGKGGAVVAAYRIRPTLDAKGKVTSVSFSKVGAAATTVTRGGAIGGSKLSVSDRALLDALRGDLDGGTVDPGGGGVTGSTARGFWGDLWDATKAGFFCAAAVVEGGANVAADIACVDAVVDVVEDD